jgi:hypothetical protein
VSYTPVLPPYPHQQEALAKMEGRRAFALLMEMRTGKTKVMLDDWGRMEAAGEVRDLLYLSPSGALYGEDALETQVPQHMPPDLRERARVAVWRADSAPARRSVAALLEERDPARPRVLLGNVESLSANTGLHEACQQLLAAGRAMMVVGESTCIKGKSRRTEAVLDLSQAALYRRIETGLVAPHSPLDLYYQFNFLDPSILRCPSWWGFRARYAVMRQVCFLPAEAQAQLRAQGRRPPLTNIVVGYRNEQELTGLIEPHSYRRRFRDCARAPAGAYRFRDVDLTPEQMRMYREFREYATTAIAGAEAHMTATVALTQVLRLHQLVCGYVVDEQGVVHDVPERRSRALLDLLSDHDGQAVVWCSYNHNIRRLSALLQQPSNLGPGSVAHFWGGNTSSRVVEEREFKEGRRRVMLANPAAGGKGRDWQCANLMVYYSNSPNLEHRDQSEMRVEAVGKVDPVTRVDLRVPGTVDDHMVKNLRAKIDIASTLQGDGYRSWLV